MSHTFAQPLDRIDAVLVLPQPEIGDDDVYRGRFRIEQAFRLIETAARDDAAAKILEQSLHPCTYLDFVIDHQYARAVEFPQHCHGVGWPRGRYARVCLANHGDREHGATSGLALHLQLQPEQIRKPPHDRKAESESLRAVPLRIGDLIELLEDAFPLAGRN